MDFVEKGEKMYNVAEKSQKIDMAKEISQKLGFRDSASEFFNLLNTMPADNIEIDFKDVKFMSRSFAHEYLQRKKELDKRVIELNKPDDVDSMFKVVIESIKNPKKIKIESSGIIHIT